MTRRVSNQNRTVVAVSATYLLGWFALVICMAALIFWTWYMVVAATEISALRGLVYGAGVIVIVVALLLVTRAIMPLLAERLKMRREQLRNWRTPSELKHDSQWNLPS